MLGDRRGEGRQIPATTALRCILAANPSPLTLDGTRTYIIGERRIAIIDPGPSLPEHVDALIAAAGDSEAAILLTHQHPDHAEAADQLASALDAPVFSAHSGLLPMRIAVGTDAGTVVAVPTPGHTPDHLAFHWPAAASVFCGDLMLGGLDTALVAPPEGDLASYLQSLHKLADLEPRRIYPAHGPPFEEPAEALARYIRHREARAAQVLERLTRGPATADELLVHVYGDTIEPTLSATAAGALRAYLDHLARQGRIEQSGERWVLRA
ncbi:MAG: MBL fold metallo-hydrolase [Longimicrobiales bacterium]